MQQLQPRDYTQRMTFAHEMQAIFEQNDNLILCISDEAHFYLDGMVNQQNCHYWASENLKQLHKRLLHSPKMMVWCTMDKTGVISPYFFKDDNRNVVTLNSEHYIEMINNFFLSKLDENVFPSNMCGFNRMGQQPTQLEHQWTLFALSFLVTSFPGLATFMTFSVP